MPGKKKFYTKHPIDYSKHLPDFDPPLTTSQRQLYNLVYSFGLNGCWMSNATIGKILHKTRRTIQIARGRLHTTRCIIIARCNPRTFSMWAVKHPGLYKTKVLYYKGGQIPNPVNSHSGAQHGGAQKLRPGGAKFAPKREEYTTPTEYIHSGGPLKGGRPAAGTKPYLRGSAPEPPGGSETGAELSRFDKILIELYTPDKTALEVTKLFFSWGWSKEKIQRGLIEILSGQEKKGI